MKETSTIIVFCEFANADLNPIESDIISRALNATAIRKVVMFPGVESIRVARPAGFC